MNKAQTAWTLSRSDDYLRGRLQQIAKLVRDESHWKKDKDGKSEMVISDRLDALISEMSLVADEIRRRMEKNAWFTQEGDLR